MHARLGRRQFEGLEQELEGIQHERDNETIEYEGIIARSKIIDIKAVDVGLQDLLEIASEEFAKRYNLEANEIFKNFAETGYSSYKELEKGVYLNDATLAGIEKPESVIFRVTKDNPLCISAGSEHVDMIVYLAVPQEETGLEFRIAGHLSKVVQQEDFKNKWFSVFTPNELREILVNDGFMLHKSVGEIKAIMDQVDKELSQIELPEGVTIQMIEREQVFTIASPKEKLQYTDKVILVGDPKDLKTLLSEIFFFTFQIIEKN